ncbi:MAG: hypothetical protein JAY69_05460, partial [Candidatus Thiodiazotropha taylori]|nr:hypothetical protein [Candidatus Thiodiazotropha taylori]MCW4232058.1 hypothetical protein [Candidatus Thiodiazotropha taylori]
MKLVISIVYYDSRLDILRDTLQSIVSALDYTLAARSDLEATVVVVDNGSILSKVKQLVGRVVG